MTIIFLCGSLEPGRDGVGDYTRRLAVELLHQGHKAGVIALNDYSLTADFESTKQFGEIIDLPMLRLPSVWPIDKRYTRAKEWMVTFNPDWVSLQFVPFSFHSKGLPFGLTKQLLSLGKGWRWHIMFHELWVGMRIHASKKHVLWGWLQRFMIQLLVSKLNPGVIHTQTWLYKAQLAKINIKAELLPLYSNIPLVHKPESNIDLLQHSKEVTLVLFGQIHPYAHVEPFIKALASYKKNKDVDVCLQMVGRSGPELSNWVRVCNATGVKIMVLGELSPEHVSEVLQKASIGISTTALPMIQKSGSVAAMREHGLPVICISKTWQPRGIAVHEPPDGIFEFQEGILDTWFNTPINDHAALCISIISKTFVEALKCYN